MLRIYLSLEIQGWSEEEQVLNSPPSPPKKGRWIYTWCWEIELLSVCNITIWLNRSAKSDIILEGDIFRPLRIIFWFSWCLGSVDYSYYLNIRGCRDMKGQPIVHMSVKCSKEIYA